MFDWFEKSSSPRTGRAGRPPLGSDRRPAACWDRAVCPSNRLPPLLARAFSLPGAKAVALAINSPGGSPVQSALIAQRIRLLAPRRNCRDRLRRGCGGLGRLLAGLRADEIIADPASIVGSIGVISAGFGFQDFLAPLRRRAARPYSGERKAMLDPFRPENPDDVEAAEAPAGRDP